MEPARVHPPPHPWQRGAETTRFPQRRSFPFQGTVPSSPGCHVAGSCHITPLQLPLHGRCCVLAQSLPKALSYELSHSVALLKATAHVCIGAQSCVTAPGAIAGDVEGSCCTHPVPHTPVKSPRCQPFQAIVPVGGQLGKFGGVYSTPGVREMLAAPCRRDGESSRHVRLREARRALLFIVLKEHVYFNLRDQQ